MAFKHDIFLCLQFICCAFCSDLKSENMRDSYAQRWSKKWRSIEILFFLFKSYLSIQFWGSFKRLQYGGSRDHKMSFIYVLVTKISERKLGIQITSTNHCCSGVHFHCLFWKGKDAQNLFSDLISGSCHCDRVRQLWGRIVQKTLLTKAQIL